jgi:hypothetical protein
MRAVSLRRVCITLILLIPVAGFADPAVEGCSDSNPLRNLYVGDLHVHTALSLDAATQDTRARPADAYRFAKGESIGVQPYDADGKALRSQQLLQPLDFAAVTDHSELLGEVELCQTPGSVNYGTWQCVLYRQWPRGAYYFFNFVASKSKRLGNCGEDGSICREAASGPWEEIRRAAAEANEPCRFSSFLAYEWTGAEGTGNNLHRNVVFRGADAPRLPVSFVDSRTPERLWKMLDEACSEAGPGCDWLAIPHNANLSGGKMFGSLRSDGAPFLREDAERRARAEPLFEIMQHKGASECVAAAAGPGVGADESCDFEQLPYDSFAGQVRPWEALSGTHQTGYYRDVLRTGLGIERSVGADPYRMGVIGSTDTHLGIAGATLEDRFIGHGGAGQPARDGVPAGLPDALEFGPGGLAMVWAEQNTRDAIFSALRRRETYATSGNRPQLRFFGGFDYPAGLCSDPELVRKGYAGGVPMGGGLRAAPGQSRAPTFVVAASRDMLSGQPLSRLQVVKGWLDADGQPQEAVLDLARAEKDAVLDPASCSSTPGGAATLCAQWEDPSWKAGETAWYYARALENPSCRWSQKLCVAAGVRCEDASSTPDGYESCCSPAHRPTVQERAWSSPIWVLPAAAPDA